MEELLLQARQGDRSAEDEIFRYLEFRFTYIAKQYLSREDAEDVAHDTCITVLQKYRTEEFSESFEAWSYGILRFKIGNFFQKQRVRRRLTSSADPLCDISENSHQKHDLAPDFLRRLTLCFQRLLDRSPRYARVLNLSHQGYDATYICSKLGIKRGNLYMMLHRGRATLSDCLRRGDS